ncbi:MAG: hypothetical protein ACODAU_01235 [Myxococcota bacterium]
MRGKKGVLLAFALAVGGCGGCEEEEPDEASPAEASTAAAEARDETDLATEAAETEGDPPDPCKVLSETLVRETLDVPEEAKLDQRRFDIRHPMCSYGWEKPDADELRAEVEEKQQERKREMMKRMQEGKGIQGLLDMATDMPSLESKVSLTLAAFDPKDEASAEKRFEGIVRTMNRGVKQKVEAAGSEQEVELKTTTEPVDGVGDQAAWGERLSQLSVRSGTRIFHVSAEVGATPEENLEAAKKLAAAVVDQL